jgi:lipopolysaccharide transport system permease protein
MASVTAPPSGGSSAISDPDRAALAVASAIPIVRIEPPRGWLNLRMAELWEYRELLYFFVWRDIKVRYKQTVIGVA